MRVLGRAVVLAAMLALTSVALFYLLHAMPGDPESLLLATNPELSATDVARIRELRGLDRPIHERYVCWLLGRGTRALPERAGQGGCAYWPTERGLLGGELGYSSLHKRPVAELFALRLPATLTLMLPAFLLGLLLSVPLGVLAALRQGRVVDLCISAVTFLGISLPLHWLGLLAVLLFAVELRWLPASGVRDPGDAGLASHLAHAILPVAVLASYYVGRWARYVRASMIEVLGADFIRAARARGLPERVVLLRHALPNALVPLLTVVAQSLPVLFSGAVVVERVFSYPGMGTLIFESVLSDDHLVAIVAFLAYAALTMGATLAADGVHALLDPRVRTGAPPAPMSLDRGATPGVGAPAGGAG